MRSKLLTTLIDTLRRPHTSPPLSSITSSSPLRRPTIHKPPLPSLQPIANRTFTTIPHPLKKGHKQDSKNPTSPNPSKPPPPNAFDFTDYSASIARAHSTLKSDLAAIKAGGLSPETVENVRVQLVKGEKKDANTTVKIGDVASVLVRGRNVCVLVGEKDHIKPILSALYSPPTNLSPNPSPTDPLTLLIPIPPTTQESRRAAQAVASKKGEEALFALRQARGAQRKRHRGLGLGRLVGPDELRRAEKEVERLNGEAVGEAKRVVEGCRKGLEGGVG